MKIWELRSSDKSIAIRSKNNQHSYISDYFNGQNLKQKWEPFEVESYKKGKHQDFPYYAYSIPVFTQKCIDLLNPLIGKHVEYLEVIFRERELIMYFVNVLTLLDALDFERSNIDWSRTGKISYINRFFFKKELLKEVSIFKIPESGRVFVSDEFRNLVLNSKLKGFEFIEVWDSEFTVEKELEQKNRYKAKLAEIERTKGQEFDWAEAVKRVEAGKAVRSSKWKLQKDKEGNIVVGHLSEEDCSYFWTDPIYYPPILLDLQWHETEKSDI